MKAKSEKIQIEDWIGQKRCAYCGKASKFQCWQYYNINQAKHYLLWWCSENCLSKAEGANTKNSSLNHGKFHSHKGNVTCYGEFDVVK